MVIVRKRLRKIRKIFHDYYVSVDVVTNVIRVIFACRFFDVGKAVVPMFQQATPT